MREILRSDSERERFKAYVDASDPDGCWPWLGQINAEGYGKFHARRDRDGRRRWVSILAHRVAYVYIYGELPAETLDHLCHTRDPHCVAGPNCRHRRCVRPSHLEAVPNLVNIERGHSGIRQSEKTRCPQGHAYSEDNIVWVVRTKGRDAGKTSRLCRVCWINRGRAASNRYHHAKAERMCRVQVGTCSADGHAWVRPAQVGRMPTRCPAHRAMRPEPTLVSF